MSLSDTEALTLYGFGSFATSCVVCEQIISHRHDKKSLDLCNFLPYLAVRLIMQFLLLLCPPVNRFLINDDRDPSIFGG